MRFISLTFSVVAYLRQLEESIRVIGQDPEGLPESLRI